MKVLVIGSGGREHALVWKISKSDKVTEIFAAPGSDAIGQLAKNIPIKVTEIEKLVNFAKTEDIGLTMVGPEDPLTMGIVDKFQQAGLKVVGPSKSAARLEGSKAFSKIIMQKYGIPTAEFEIVSNINEGEKAIETLGLPLAIKADGLAAGKGVLLCKTYEEASNALKVIMTDKKFGSAGDKVVVERLMSGEEASFIALTDGKTVLPMVSSQDHKRALDGDKGLNTGGMGAYSPAPVVTEEMHQKIMDQVMQPTVDALAHEGCPFVGVLYAGVMVENGVPNVLEFNVRFGDPETQPIMARLETDFVELLEATVDGKLDQVEVKWDPRPCVCVVMASGGYPENYEKGFEIIGIDEAEKTTDVTVFHAGTKLVDGKWTNTGGRVLGVTVLGDNIEATIKKSYEAVCKIKWEKVHYRNDIAKRALGRM